MAELEQALDRLLADPEAMAQIMELAGKLGGPSDAPDRSGPAQPSPEGPPPPNETAAPDLDRLAPLLSLLQSGGGADPRSEALLNALRPYLSEARRKKLDRAIRMSALARTARTALGLWKEGKLSV